MKPGQRHRHFEGDLATSLQVTGGRYFCTVSGLRLCVPIIFSPDLLDLLATRMKKEGEGNKSKGTRGT